MAGRVRLDHIVETSINNAPQKRHVFRLLQTNLRTLQHLLEQDVQDFALAMRKGPQTAAQRARRPTAAGRAAAPGCPAGRRGRRADAADPDAAGGAEADLRADERLVAQLAEARAAAGAEGRSSRRSARSFAT